jgi:HlyD family secretion protein
VVKSPATGVVDQVLRRVGEIAAPEAPVLSLLPDGNRIVRFFVPEELRSRITPGMGVAISCDGCPEGLTAKVSYVAAEAEYTPPVIYSVESRRKLVFMIEAEPERDARALNPGQPVSVRLMKDGGQ